MCKVYVALATTNFLIWWPHKIICPWKIDIWQFLHDDVDKWVDDVMWPIAKLLLCGVGGLDRSDVTREQEQKVATAGQLDCDTLFFWLQEQHWRERDLP